MTQQTSPFIEGKYGWALGEGNWNLGMDENLLKFSYLFDRNIDGIVSSLPAAVNGTAYFNTTDNRIYFAAGGVYSSTPVPKWFEVTLRSSGQIYQFDGTTLNLGSTTTNSIDSFIAEVASPSGSGEVGHQRSVLSSSITTAKQMLDAQSVNIWEFAQFATGYSPGGNPATWDWTPARVAAHSQIKVLSAFGGGILVYPPGQYPHTQLVREKFISSLGSGSGGTYLTALPFNPDGDYGFIEIADGPVTRSHFKGFTILGSATVSFGAAPVNAAQWGMYIKAKWDASYTSGGLWYSDHEDLIIGNFNKGMWSRAGYTTNNYLRPNQWLSFKQVMVQVPTGGEAVRFTGQHGQISWFGGAAEGRDGAIALRCMTLDYDPNPATMADNASGHGESTSDVAGVGAAVQVPLSPMFSGRLSLQKSQEGVFCRVSRGATFENLFVENIGKMFTVQNGGQMHVDSCRLANAADGSLFGSAGSGYLWSIASLGTLTFGDKSDVLGTTDNYSDPAMNLNNVSGTVIKGGVSGAPAGKYKAAADKSITLASSTIDVQAHRFAVVNNGADKTIKLTTMNSTAAPNETVYLRPTVGPITLASGGNISLNGLSEITVPTNGLIAILRRYQVGGSGEWMVLSTPEHFATAEPTNGYYYARGTKVWNSAPVAGGSMGWEVVTAGIAGTTAVFKAMPNLSA